MTRGITAVEMLVLVAFVAVLTLVAIPHMSRGRQATDQTRVAVALVDYADAQQAFRSRDCGRRLHGEIAAGYYCPDFALLGGVHAAVVDGRALDLLPDAMANASRQTPYAGCFFSNDPYVTDWRAHFGLFARPVRYDAANAVMFHIGTNRVICVKDPGPSNALMPVDSTWTTR